MKTKEYDFVVIGSGIAGLSFALRCADHGRVLIVTKSSIADTNTQWAQGGVAAAVGEDDSWELHEEDTLKAGAGLCDVEAVRFLVKNARPSLEWLISVGAQFDMDRANGLPKLKLGLEGGHSRHRIVHSADRSGWEIERALSEAVVKHPSIQIQEFAFADALCISDDRCVGALLRPKDREPYIAATGSTMLATGSCCQVYRFTTNPEIATGDGVALANAVGAKIENMEFIQFHPTTLYSRRHRGFLITEAIRGEGAILRTIHGRRFMFDYHPDAELAPRDVVARAIHAEILKEGVPFVHLDMTHMPKDHVDKRFPTVTRKLKELGIDVHRDPIPVVPAAHYQCGGVVTNLDGEASIPGLYAAGEVACTGVHGANRLASNSLLEALVFGLSAADHATTHKRDPQRGEPHPSSVPVVSRLEVSGVVRRLKRLMWENVGIVRRNRGLRFAVEEIEDLRDSVQPESDFYVTGAQARNLLICGSIIARSARDRKENVGLHYNEDLARPSAPPPRARAGS